METTSRVPLAGPSPEVGTAPPRVFVGAALGAFMVLLDVTIVIRSHTSASSRLAVT